MKFQVVLILLLLTFYASFSRAQTFQKFKPNALILEIGKTGLLYNLSFDHRFKDHHAGVRVGIGSNFAKYLNAFSTGGGAYYLFGKSERSFELGVDLNYLSVNEISDDQKGFALIYPSYTIKTFYASLNCGYRKYKNKSLFRIGISPGIIKTALIPGGYISYGFIF